MSFWDRMRGGSRPRSAWIVAALVLTLVGGALALTLGDRHDTSARLGGVGTRTFPHPPDDLPEGIVPDRATEVEGTAAATDERWTAAVSFVVADSDRDAVREHVEAVLGGSGYELRQRAFDDTSFEAIYDGPEATVLTVSYESIEQGTGTAIVLQGRRD